MHPWIRRLGRTIVGVLSSRKSVSPTDRPLCSQVEDISPAICSECNSCHVHAHQNSPDGHAFRRHEVVTPQQIVLQANHCVYKGNGSLVPARDERPVGRQSETMIKIFNTFRSRIATALCLT